MKKIITMILFAGSLILLFSPTASAHELFIQLDEQEGELRVDVLWGHIRDYVDVATHEDYQLFVRDPNGDTEQLDMENIGVHARSYVPITEEGTYTFWATREPGTHSPEDGLTQQSIQMAKAVYSTGNGQSNTDESVDMDLEIIPTTELDHFTGGEFTGTIEFDGEPSTDTELIAYGPEGEVLDTTADDEGNFNFTLDSQGQWLIKGNLVVDEAGSLNGEDYDEIGYTSTLIIDTQEEGSAELTEPSDSTNSTESSELTNSTESSETTYSIWSLVAIGICGLLVGAAISLLFKKKK